MTVLAKIKKLVPTTPKGWILAGAGVGAAGLAANYFIAGADASVLGRLFHALHGGGGGGGPSGGPHHGPAHTQHPMGAPGMMPMMPQQPMVFVEPTMAPNFFYRFQHGEHGEYHHAPPMHHPMHAPPYGAPHPHFDFHAEHQSMPHMAAPMYPHGHHVAGVASAPHNPEESRMHVYAPGAKGIANEPTTQAAGIVDPSAVTAGDYGWE